MVAVHEFEKISYKRVGWSVLVHSVPEMVPQNLF